MRDRKRFENTHVLQSKFLLKLIAKATPHTTGRAATRWSSTSSPCVRRVWRQLQMARRSSVEFTMALREFRPWQQPTGGSSAFAVTYPLQEATFACTRAQDTSACATHGVAQRSHSRSADAKLWKLTIPIPRKSLFFLCFFLWLCLRAPDDSLYINAWKRGFK